MPTILGCLAVSWLAYSHPEMRFLAGICCGLMIGFKSCLYFMETASYNRQGREYGKPDLY